ncbi:zinc finger and SCAN domain-containing protein 2-like [Cotesia glomerata]|uniref:zinc finger and SCAN domain-containing protein 2-like n=1 Tax=Cotesia glomerata TaxID=32391 RepID=UPI001D0156DD|nr:zinc finger and SCAN domain-containing protein 2-like [Cotesia glomerata]XP_044592933.1 zinc finger and SCAN domain-containing protein 2-like [Cotesia glomerata]
MSTFDYMDLCRLCLVKDQVSVPIFEGDGDARQIFHKIAFCLPVKVNREDKLPKKICDDCAYKVELCYQFYNTTANAEKQLMQWLGEVGLEDKQGYEQEVMTSNIMKQEQVDNRINVTVISNEEQSNSMEINMIDGMSLSLPIIMNQQMPAVSMSSTDNLQSIQSVAGTSVQATGNRMRKDGEEIDTEEDDNSDDECDADDGLQVVKEESENTSGSRSMESTTYVNVLPCSEAGPSGLQKQKLSDIIEMGMQQSEDNTKTGYLNKSGRTGASGDPRGFFIFDKESVVMRKWQILEFDGKPYYAFVPEDEEPVNIDNIPSSEDQPEFELEPPNHTPEINFLHQDEPEADPELAEEHIIKDFNLPVQCKTEVLHQEEENEHMSVENDASFYDYQYDDTSIMNDSEETEMKPILMNNICGTEGKEATRGDLYECKIEGSIVTIEKLAENVVSVDNSTKNDDNDDEDDDNNHDNDTQYDHDNNNDSYEGYNYEENDTCELEDQEEQIQEVEEFVESEEIEEIETDQQIGSQSEFIEEEEVEEVEGIEENEGEIEVEYEGENEGEEVELEEDIEVDAEGNIISENITEEEQAQEVPQYIEFDSIDSQVIEYATENEEDVDDVGVEKIQEAPQATVVPVGVATKNHRQTRYRPILPKSMPTFRCTLCSETFPSKIAFRKHVAWTHKKKVCIQEDGAYVCAVCDYRTLKKNLFAAHLERKHETWPKKGSSNVDFPCVVCGFKCRSKHSLQSHFIRKHTDTFEHQCKFCPKQFKVKGDLTNHVRFHHKEKPVNCTVCGKLCQNSGSLYVHQKWAHFKPKFECKICKRRMVTQENLEQHMLTQHEKREKIVCAECGKTFTKKDSFKRHMAVHTGSKPHNCPICNKAFARQSQLRQHVLIHTGKRPFVCDICGKAFTQKPGLICHRKTHPGSHPPLPAMPIADIVKEFTEGYLRGNGAHANDINEDEVEAISD